MKIEFKSVLETGLDETLRVLNLGFSDYFVPIQVDLGGFMHMCVVDGIDLALSRVSFQNGTPAGVGLIARRGWTSRLAAMAVVPDMRRQGVGRLLMEKLIEESIQRGDRRIELEVIQENHPAVQLYQDMAFKARRQLLSYRLDPAPPGTAHALNEIDLLTAARLVTAWGLPDLPWQLSGESLALATPPGRAYQLGEAVVILSDPTKDTISLRSLVTKPNGAYESLAQNLLDALFNQFQGKVWVVPALWPEESCGVLEKTGFKLGKLSQFQMYRDLI